MVDEVGADLSDHEAHSDVSGGLASRVLLDRVHRTATKEYRPPIVVKVLYWLAFQSPFPYVRNEPSLRAARARRTSASLMTKFWFGTDQVAATVDIRCDDKGCIFVTQLIEGQVPKDKKRARAFLRKLTPRFQEVGLPTWQVLPSNPKATGNLIETRDGSYKIIDLESGVVNPMMPIGQWIDAIKAGLIPVFDDVFVAKTRSYIAKHDDEIEAALGPDGLRQLQHATDEYQSCAEQWQKSELRIWGKLLQLVLKVGSIALKPLRLLLKPLRLLWPPDSSTALRICIHPSGPPPQGRNRGSGGRWPRGSAALQPYLEQLCRGQLAAR